MKKVNNNSINISKNGGFVEAQLIECIKDIIFKLQMEFDIEYNDATYRELYIKTAQFAKEVDEVLSSEITQRDDIFKSTPDYFSFKNDKLV
jgi:hypothetical protein